MAYQSRWTGEQIDNAVEGLRQMDANAVGDYVADLASILSIDDNGDINISQNGESLLNTKNGVVSTRIMEIITQLKMSGFTISVRGNGNLTLQKEVG